MKRDLDILRQIMLAVEAAEGTLDSTTLPESLASQPVIQHHCLLLLDAGFATGEGAASSTARNRVYLHRLTHLGHDYLDTVRDEATWRAVKQSLKHTVATTSLDVVKALAVAVATKTLFLH